MMISGIAAPGAAEGGGATGGGGWTAAGPGEVLARFGDGFIGKSSEIQWQLPSGKLTVGPWK